MSFLYPLLDYLPPTTEYARGYHVGLHLLFTPEHGRVSLHLTDSTCVERKAMEKKIVYFEQQGKANTDDTLKMARERARELGIDQVVVATTHGYTAQMAKSILGDLGMKIIAVSICASYDEEGWTMSREERKSLEDIGITVVTTMHALGDDVNEAFSGDSPNRIVRDTLYRFSQGMKVAVEISLMASDAGVIDTSREVIAIAGTGEGADTAIVLKPAFSRRFKDLEIREILAKPRLPS